MYEYVLIAYYVHEAASEHYVTLINNKNKKDM